MGIKRKKVVEIGKGFFEWVTKKYGYSQHYWREWYSKKSTPEERIPLLKEYLEVINLNGITM